MKLNLEKLSSLQRKLHIEVPTDMVAAAFDRVYKALQQQVELKGFRKGKAPLAQIRSMYSARVADDVARELVQEYYVRGLQDQSLNPISTPEIEFDPVSESEPFKFSASFDIRPDIKIKKFEGLEVEKEVLADDPSVVDSTLERMRSSRAKEEPLILDRPAKSGDLVTIDFDGVVDGKALDRGAGKAQTLELGNSGFIEGFDEGMLGMNVGETRTLELKFPEGYHAAELSGKPVQFKVTLHRLGMKVLPELNNEFAAGFGEFKTLSALKEAVLSDWRRGEETRINKDLRAALLKALVEANPVEIPPSILKEQKKALVQDLHRRMEEQGMPHDQFQEYAQKWDSDLEESAKFIIQSSFLVSELADQHGLRCTDEVFGERLKTYAVQTGIDLARLKEYYAKGEAASNMRFQITEENVVTFLTSKAKVKEVPASKLKKE